MAATRTTQSNILRRVYVNRVRQMFNLRSIFMQAIERNNEEYSEGEHISVTRHSGVSGGFGYSDAGAIPAASHQVFERATFNYKRLIARIRVSIAHMEGAKRSYAADVDPLQTEMKKMVPVARHALNYDLVSGDGSGIIADPATATSTTSFTVSSTRGLLKGYRIDVLTKSTGNVDGGVVNARISVDHNTNTVTLLDGATLFNFADINSNPTLYGVYRAGCRNQAPMGLNGIVSASNPASGSYGGVDRTVAGNEDWKAQSLFNSGTLRFPTLKLLDDMWSMVDANSEGECDLILAPYSLWGYIANLLESQRRYEAQRTVLNGWAEAITFRGIPIVREKHMPTDRLFFLDTSTFSIYQNDEGKWLDDDGHILHRVQGVLELEATWYRFLQLICTAPNANGVLGDLKAA